MYGSSCDSYAFDVGRFAYVSSNLPCNSTIIYFKGELVSENVNTEYIKWKLVHVLFNVQSFTKGFY